MRIEQLQYFLEVAQSGSFNKAARKFFVTQQGLSDAMKRLEVELDMQLFKRSKVGVTLTEDGAFFVDYAEDILTAYDRLNNALAKRRSEAQNTVESLLLYICPLLANTILPDILDRSQSGSRQINLLCQEMEPNKIVEKIKTADDGVGLVVCQDSAYDELARYLGEEILIWHLCSDEVMAAVSVRSPLYSRKFISLEEYRAQTLVGFAQSDYVGMPPAPSARNMRYISTSLALHQKLVLDNQACGSMTSLLSKKLFTSPQIKAIPIKPQLKVHYLMLMRENNITEGTRIFMRHISDYIYAMTNKRPEGLEI